MSTRPFLDVAWSTHPVAATAVGEIVAELRDRKHDRPDVLFVFVTRPFAGALEDIAPALQRLLSPETLIGCSARQIFGPDGWLEQDAAISVFVMNHGEAVTHRFEPGDSIELPHDTPSVVIATPTTAEPEQFCVSGGRTTGDPMVLDGHLYMDGAVAITFPPDSRAESRHELVEEADVVLSFIDADLYEFEREERPIFTGFASSRPFNNSLTVFRAKSTSESRRG